MTASDFPRSLRLVLIDEGGCDDDPHDHGGRTAHGIIQREYDGFRERHGQMRQDVWKITPAEYTEIYHDRYWMPWCDRMPAGMDYVFFDHSVNAGPVAAVKMLQKVLGLRIDGHMGEVLLNKLAAVPADEMEAFIHKFCEARRAFYRALAQFPRYGRGWLSRVDHVEKGAKQIWLTGEHPVRNGFDDQLKAQASARANEKDVAQAPITTEMAASTATASAIGTGLMGKLEPVVSQLTTLQGMVQGVEYVLAAITIVGIGFTLYALWHKSKTQEAVA